jgi:hypothetical protein
LACAFGFSESRQPELQRYLTLQPDSWFIGVLGNSRPVAMVGAVNYDVFAYVGMMAVHPDAQRQGFGMCMMKHLLADLKRKGCLQVLLDASPSGHPLYLHLGFEDDGLANIYSLHDSVHLSSPTSGKVQLMEPADLPELAAFDLPIFGADRSHLFKLMLDELAGRAFLTRSSRGRVSGLLFAQTNGRIGPWLADNPAAATGLLNAALRLPYYQAAPWVISPSINEEAGTLLRETGFIYERCCTHMRLGGDCVPGRRGLIYGQCSMAIG